MAVWTESARHRAPFGLAPKGMPHLRAVERLKEWTRSRFDLGASDPVIVSESTCFVPGGPPTQTVVAFWTREGLRHRFRVFKPVHDIDEADVPPSWLKATLSGDDGIANDCC